VVNESYEKTEKEAGATKIGVGGGKYGSMRKEVSQQAMQREGTLRRSLNGY